MKMWVRTRVAHAILGALLVGGITVTLIVWPSLQLGLRTGAPTGSTSQSQQATQAHSNAQTDAQGGTNTPSSGGGSPPAPAPATPSGQRGPSGQPVDLHGNLVQVNTAGSYFTYQELGGPLDTIYVTATSRYTGSASSLSTLTPGRAAEVVGVRQSATTCVATLVDEASDNG